MEINFPASQVGPAVQALEPADGAYLAEAQGVHTDAPEVEEYVPALQIAQSAVDPEPETNFPAPQEAQAVEPTFPAYVAVAHVVHTLLPELEEYFPDTHKPHEVVPEVTEALPAGQVKHSASGPEPDRYSPEAQEIHELDSALVVYVPAAHAVHALLPTEAE